MLGNPEPLDLRSQLIKTMNGGLMCLEKVSELAAAHPEVYDAQSDEGWTPLHFATEPDLAKLLIAKGACVDEKTGDGMTPLHLAAIDGSNQCPRGTGAYERRGTSPVCRREQLECDGQDIQGKSRPAHRVSIP
jgi:ankyrin repeat protein